MLFVVAMLAATIVPGSSELMLVALVANEPESGLSLVAVATVGNTLGAVINWCLGRWLLSYAHRPWFPISSRRLEQGSRLFRKYGTWSLLFSWVPVVGDPLTVAAGVFRVPLPLFVLLTGFGKGARYLLLVGGLKALQLA
jgi:membrane protein YqaA with SNARE-associated domain